MRMGTRWIVGFGISLRVDVFIVIGVDGDLPLDSWASKGSASAIKAITKVRIFFIVLSIFCCFDDAKLQIKTFISKIKVSYFEIFIIFN